MSDSPDTPTPPLTGRRKAFRALRHRNYQLFFVGQLISLIGTWMQQTAHPLLVVDLAKDNPGLWLGIVGFVPLIPLVPLALIAGSLADRYPKRTIIIMTQTVMMLQAFALAYLKLSGTIQLWHVFVLALVSGAANAIDVPARQSFVVEMVGHRDDLDSGIALNSAIFNLSRAIGPVLAALLIAPLGLGVAFLINGVSFLAVIASLLMMRLPAMPTTVRPPKMGSHLTAGLRYVWQQQSLRVLMSMVAVAAFLSMPFMTLMPVFVQTDVLARWDAATDRAVGGQRAADQSVGVRSADVSGSQCGALWPVDGRVWHGRTGGGVAGGDVWRSRSRAMDDHRQYRPADWPAALCRVAIVLVDRRAAAGHRRGLHFAERHDQHAGAVVVPGRLSRPDYECVLDVVSGHDGRGPDAGRA